MGFGPGTRGNCEIMVKAFLRVDGEEVLAVVLERT